MLLVAGLMASFVDTNARIRRDAVAALSEQDAEIELLKAGVSCAALLERLPPVWRLDRAESSRRSLKIPPRRRRDYHREP